MRAISASLFIWTLSFPVAAQVDVLTSFNGTDGAGPDAGIILEGDMLYGTTGGGGAYDYGEVYSLAVSGGTPTVLATFDGSHPDTALVDSGTELFGTTENGGSQNYGQVYAVPVTGGTVTTVASFNSTLGAYPQSGVILSGSTLYGTTPEGTVGDPTENGSVYSVPVTGGTPTVLGSFNISNGAQPSGTLTLSGSTLYGTTNYGGAYGGPTGDGTIFSIPVGGGAPTVLASFNGTDGSSPYNGVIVSGNTLYGTTSAGGALGKGSIFAFSLTSGTITNLASFTEPNAGPGALTLLGNTLYGITSGGGTSGL